MVWAALTNASLTHRQWFAGGIITGEPHFAGPALGDVFQVLEAVVAEDDGLDENKKCGVSVGSGACAEEIFDDGNVADNGDGLNGSAEILYGEPPYHDGVAVGDGDGAVDGIFLAGRGQAVGPLAGEAA